MLVKVCGATGASDIALLAEAGVDLVGLWHGVRTGGAELDAARLRRLATTARESGRLEPVLVTLLPDAARLAVAVAGSAVSWVQLHGYQPPACVRALRSAAGHALTIVKVLHVRGRDCVERDLIGAYERAGVDVFLVDSTAPDGRIGSTGEVAEPRVVADLVARTSRPFLLAGGITAANRADHATTTAHPRFLGVDVDTSARTPDGRLSADRVAALTQAWRPAAPPDPAPARPAPPDRAPARPGPEPVPARPEPAKIVTTLEESRCRRACDTASLEELSGSSQGGSA